MSERNIAKAAGAVSIGSLIVQFGGILGQFIYAVWLTPADFGMWAAASAAVALIGSLTNGGETNAYLTGRLYGTAGPFKRSAVFNYILAALALFIAVNFAIFEDKSVAILITLLALGLPLQGRATMLLAVFIKIRSRSHLVSIQAIATVVRLLIGIIVAAIWQSPLALAVAHVTYSLVIVTLGQVWLIRKAPQLMKDASLPAGRLSLRVDRAVHQFSQTLPTQIDYLTISLFASAQILGLYFFAYQATSALSGMLSSPLSKATMSELSSVNSSERIPLICRLLILISALVTFGAALTSLIIEPLSSVLGERWQEVLAPFIILLSSLPARFIIPVTEALNMVNAKWRRSSWINLLDAMGIAGAVVLALVVVEGDVVDLAIYITIWKVLFGSGRAFLSLRGHRLLASIAIILPNAMFVLVVTTSVLHLGHVGNMAFAVVSAIAVVQVLIFAMTMRRARR